MLCSARPFSAIGVNRLAFAWVASVVIIHRRRSLTCLPVTCVPDADLQRSMESGRLSGVLVALRFGVVSGERRSRIVLGFVLVLEANGEGVHCCRAVLQSLAVISRSVTLDAVCSAGNRAVVYWVI